MKKKLVNFWYYNKTMVIVVTLCLAAVVYMEYLYFTTEPADYEIAVVSSEYYSDEQLAQLQALLEAAGEDRDGNGKVTVSLHDYRVLLGSDEADGEQIGALDADLVGSVSGLFLLEDAAAFQEATGGLQQTGDSRSTAGTVLAGTEFEALMLYIRPGSEEDAYSRLADSLNR